MALYAIELALVAVERFRGQAPDRDAPAKAIASEVADLRQQGVDAYPIRLPYARLRPPAGGSDSASLFPLGSISGAATVWCWRSDAAKWVVAPSDEHGFNNPPGMWTRGNIEVMLVGDSFAQGFCVDPEETIASRLRQLGADATLSVGIALDGPLLELATVSEFAQPLRPRVVYWIYTEMNDLQNLEVEWGSPVLRRYLGDYSQDLVDRQSEVDSMLKRQADQSLERVADRDSPMADREPASRIGKPRFLTLGHLRGRLGLYRPGPPLPAASTERLGEVLDRASRMVKGWDGELVFVYLPALDRYAGPLLKADDHRRDEVLALVRRLGIPVIDIHQTFSGLARPVSMFARRPNGGHGVHFGPDGYQVVARAIYEDLRSRRNRAADHPR